MVEAAGDGDRAALVAADEGVHPLPTDVVAPRGRPADGSLDARLVGEHRHRAVSKSISFAHVGVTTIRSMPS